MASPPTTRVSLLARLSAGDDQSAWRDFHDRYGALIWRVARGQGLQPADCDEVVQDVLAALIQTLPRFHYDAEKGRFRSYLRTVTFHAVFRKKRQEHAAESLSYGGETLTDDADADLERLWEAEWRQYHVRTALQRISVEFSQNDLAAFEAYALSDRDARSVAESLGMSLDRLYQAKSRILKRLTEVIAERVDEEG